MRLPGSTVRQNTGDETAIPRRLPTRKEILSRFIDGGSVATMLASMVLLARDIQAYPACESGTVIDGPDAEGYYDILKCVQDLGRADDQAFINGTLYSVEDDLTRSELYDDGLSAGPNGEELVCTTIRSQRPCDMGAVYVCEGGLDSPYPLTVVCSILWAVTQLWLAIPIMFGGINTFNLLGLFNSFCVSAIPLLVRPLANILKTMNGQNCAPDAECVLFPTTGDLVSVGLAWKAGQLAMESNMRETTTQKLNALSLSIGAIASAFVQSFFLEYIVAALSAAGGIDPALFLDDTTNGTTRNDTSSDLITNTSLSGNSVDNTTMSNTTSTAGYLPGNEKTCTLAAPQVINKNSTFFKFCMHLQEVLH